MEGFSTLPEWGLVWWWDGVGPPQAGTQAISGGCEEVSLFCLQTEQSDSTLSPALPDSSHAVLLCLTGFCS